MVNLEGYKMFIRNDFITYGTNKVSENKKNKVSFGWGFNLSPFQREQFFSNFVKLERSAAVEKLEKAFEELPPLDNEMSTLGKKVNGFFRDLLKNLQEKPESKISDAIGDSLSLEKNDPERMFIETPFKKLLLSIQNNKNYDNFLDNLSKNLFEDSAEPVLEIVEKVTVTPIKTLTDLEGNVNVSNPISGLGEQIKVLSPKSEQTSAASKTEVVERVLTGKLKEEQDELKLIIKTRQEKINDIDTDIYIAKKELEKCESELENVAEQLKKLQTNKNGKADKSMFMLAEESKNQKESKIRRLINKHFKNQTTDYEVKITHTGEQLDPKKVMKKNGTVNKKSLRREMNSRSVVEKRKIETPQSEENQNLAKYRLQIQRLRRSIAKLDSEYPNIQTVNKKIDQLKKALSPETFNEKELLELEKQTILPIEKQKQLSQNNRLISQLEENNEKLKNFTVVRNQKGEVISFETKFAELNSTKPIRENYSNEKSFVTELKKWQSKLNTLNDKKLKAKEFYTNKGMIAELEKKNSELESTKTLSPETIAKRAVLLEQRQKVQDFNSRVFDTKTGREVLEEKLKKAEKIKKYLVNTSTGAWKKEAKVSNLTDRQNIAIERSNTLQAQIKQLEAEQKRLEKLQLEQGKEVK